MTAGNPFGTFYGPIVSPSRGTPNTVNPGDMNVMNPMQLGAGFFNPRTANQKLTRFGTAKPTQPAPSALKGGSGGRGGGSSGGSGSSSYKGGSSPMGMAGQAMGLMGNLTGAETGQQPTGQAQGGN